MTISCYYATVTKQSYYDNIGHLLNTKQLEKAFVAMNIPNIVHSNDGNYWGKIPGQIAKIFKMDKQKLLAFGTALARRNETRSACFRFMATLATHKNDQSDIMKSIILEFMSHHLPQSSIKAVTKDNNGLVFFVYEIAKTHQSKDLYKVFNYLFKKIPAIEKKSELAEYYQQRIRANEVTETLISRIKNFEKSIFGDDIHSESDWANWKTCIRFARFLRVNHIEYPYDPFLWAINRMKRYKPDNDGRRYYSGIFEWIESNINVGQSKALLKMLINQFPYDKDAEWLYSMAYGFPYTSVTGTASNSSLSAK